MEHVWEVSYSARYPSIEDLWVYPEDEEETPSASIEVLSDVDSETVPSSEDSDVVFVKEEIVLDWL